MKSKKQAKVRKKRSTKRNAIASPLKDDNKRRCVTCYRVLRKIWPMKFCPICWEEFKWYHYWKKTEA